MSLKEIRIRYREACNCGYNGTLFEYIKSVGFKVKPEKEEEKKHED